MAEKTEKKKPVRLEWQGGLLDSGPGENAQAVSLKNTSSSKNKTPAPAASTHSQTSDSKNGTQNTPKNIGGTVKVRRESKGRAGKPVAFLFEFSDPAAHSTQNLKELLSKLKTHLACGGGLEDTGLVVQVDDVPRVLAALAKFGIEGKKSGG